MVPSVLERTIIQVRERVRGIRSKYGSLANYGRPVFQSIEEVAAIYYLYKKLNFPIYKIADMIGLDKTTVYKLISRIENVNSISITNPNLKLETVTIRPEELVSLVEEKILRTQAGRTVVARERSARAGEARLVGDIVLCLMEEDCSKVKECLKNAIKRYLSRLL